MTTVGTLLISNKSVHMTGLILLTCDRLHEHIQICWNICNRLIHCTLLQRTIRHKVY